MKVEITSNAKCKHCKHLKRENFYKKNGEISNKCRIVCSIGRCLLRGERSKVCDDFDPYWNK